MSRKIAEMYVELDADVRGLKTGLKKAQDSIDRLGGTTEKVGRNWKSRFIPSLRNVGSSASRSSSGIGRMVKSMLALGAAYLSIRGIGSLAKSFMEVASSTEQYKLRLDVLLGSQEAATDAMNFFRETAAKVPFTLQEVIESGTTLTAMGADLKRWTPILTDLSAVMGMKLPEAASALGRAFAGGAGAADIFRERGILQIIKDSARMKDGIEDITKLTLPQFRDAMFDAFADSEGKIAGAADKLATTWQGTISMLQDKWFQFRETVMKTKVFEVLKDGLAAFNKKLDEMIISGKMDEWAVKTARGVLQAFKVIIQGMQGLVVGIGVVRAAWYDLNKAINKLAKMTTEKQLPFYVFAGIVLPAARKEAMRLMDAIAKLDEETKGYTKSNQDMTDKAADLINVFDGLIGALDNAIGATDNIKKSTDELSGSFNDLGKPTGPIGKAKKALSEIVIGYDNWGKVVVKISEIVSNLHDNLESRFFKPVKKKLFDFKEFWKDVNEQIEASWIRGISNMITEFRNFGGAIKQLLNTIFQIFADTIGKIVVEWIKGTITIKEAFKSLGEAIKALSSAWIVWVTYVITKIFGDVNKKTAAEIALLELQIEKARKLLEEWKREGLGINLPPGDITGPDEGSMRELPDFSSLLSRIPGLLKAMIDAVGNQLRKITQVADNVWVGFADLTRWEGVQRKLDRLSRITLASFNLMMEHGYSFYDALVAIQEPLTALRDKYLEMGRQVPPALRGIIEMLEKMENRPKLYKAMSATLELFKSFVTMGYMTQELLKDFVQSTASMVRNILGVTGNLKAALADIGDLTQAQIMMLAPLITPFLQAAQQFGLKLPDWIRDLAAKMGITIEEPAINSVPPLLDRIRRRMGRETTRIVKAIHGLGKTMRKIFENVPGFAAGGIAIQPQFAKVAEHGPEAIIPLDKLQGGLGMGNQPFVIENRLYIDGKEAAIAVARHSVKLSKYGHLKLHERGLTDR